MVHSERRVLACCVLALCLPGAVVLTPSTGAFAQPTTIAQDMAAAAKRYAVEKGEETIKEQCKQAIVASYKRLYRTGADKRLLRTLGNVALSAEEIDTLAGNMAKATMLGDPEGVKGVGEQVAVALGKQMLPGLSDPELRGRMGDLLGGVEKVNEIADVAGQAAGGDNRAAMEFIGRAIIAATPAAAIFNTGEAAVGVMKYANKKFADDSLEDLYRRYTEGDADEREQIRRKLESDRVYSYIVRDRRRELAAEKAQSIRNATAELSDSLRERLEKASEADVIDDIFQSFAARAERERVAAVRAAADAKAQAQANAMLDALNSTARNRWGKDWDKTRTYDFDRYMQAVQERMRNDGVLDPDDPRHIAAMSRLLSTRLVHGANSQEYRRQLAGFEGYRRTIQGDTAAISAPAKDAAPTPSQPDKDCAAGSANRNEADRLWSQALALEKTGNFISARKMLQSSLSICADSKRAAYDETLRKKWLNSAIGKAVDGVKNRQTPTSAPERGRSDVASPQATPKKKGTLVCTCEDWNKDGAYGVVLGKEIITANYGPYAKCMAYAATLGVCYK